MVDREIIRSIITFVTVVETGSYTAAAARVRLLPAAVRRAVAQLEARIGSSLLDRSKRKVTLTDEGRRLYAEAAPVVAQLQRAIRPTPPRERSRVLRHPANRR